MSFDSSAFLATLTSRPGVYRMLDEAGDILYVGKAKNLKTGFQATSGGARKTIKPWRWWLGFETSKSR